MAESNEPSTSDVVMEVATDPDYIVYLLDPKEEYNCYFVVGNPDLGDTERIGVVKKMLMAHSAVFRRELHESKIAEKNDVKLIDVFPRTFKNLLRFVYGFDNTQELSFDEADDLLYVADKYMIPKLKNRLATRLMSLLNCNNICSLMNNPAVYTVLELHYAMTDILQTKTEKVLASPQFLDLSSVAFLKILEQEVSNVPEIELWRAAINWAKNQGQKMSENGNVLRNKLKTHLKRIRVCTLSAQDVFLEVVPTKVLRYDELVRVAESQKTGQVQTGLTTICNAIEGREQPLVPSELLHQSLAQNDHHYNSNCTETKFKLKTKDAAIELCSVTLFASSMSDHQCNCAISIQRDAEPPVVARFQGQVSSATGWVVPIIVEEKNFHLSANSSNLIKFTFSCSYSHYCRRPNSPYTVSGSHFTVDFELHSNSGYYLFQVNDIRYKTLTKRVKFRQT